MAEDTSRRVQLSRPIQAHGEDVAELVFVEPTGAQIARCGMPVVVDFTTNPPAISFDAPRMRAMIGELATIPPSAVDSLAANDWVNAAWAIADFFVPSLGRT